MKLIKYILISIMLIIPTYGMSNAFLNKYGNKLIEMFDALRIRGLSNQVAFEISFQSLKERPSHYYSFGHNEPTVDAWANNVVNHQLKRNIYKNAINAKSFDEYLKFTKHYNTKPTYPSWLKKGRETSRNFINDYIKKNNLGNLIL